MNEGTILKLCSESFSVEWILQEKDGAWTMLAEGVPRAVSFDLSGREETKGIYDFSPEAQATTCASPKVGA